MIRADALDKAQKALKGYGLSIRKPGEVALIGCQRPGCGCEFTVDLREYLALPPAEIGCPKCSISKGT